LGTATFAHTAGIVAVQQRSLGVQQQALGALPLPATWTPANPASAYVPLIVAAYDHNLL
jgi:hypothetical protein